jgi:hypothetical protein
MIGGKNLSYLCQNVEKDEEGAILPSSSLSYEFSKSPWRISLSPGTGKINEIVGFWFVSIRRATATTRK